MEQSTLSAWRLRSCSAAAAAVACGCSASAASAAAAAAAAAFVSIMAPTAPSSRLRLRLPARRTMLRAPSRALLSRDSIPRSVLTCWQPCAQAWGVEMLAQQVPVEPAKCAQGCGFKTRAGGVLLQGPMGSIDSTINKRM